MIAKVFFGDVQAGESRTRAGLSSVVVCSIHLNNVYAKKTDVARFLLVAMFKACVGAACTVVGGDFDAAADALAEECLNDAIRDLGVACRYNRLRSHREDCILVFVLSYEENQTFQIKQCKQLADVVNQHLYLFSTDKDWHVPILVHLRNNAHCSTTVRQRGRSRSAERKQEKRAKWVARKKAAAFSSTSAGPVPHSTTSSSNAT